MPFPSETVTPKTQRRWRFSLRGLWVVITAIGVYFGLVVHRVRQQSDQEEQALASIRALGCRVEYQYHCAAGGQFCGPHVFIDARRFDEQLVPTLQRLQRPVWLGVENARDNDALVGQLRSALPGADIEVREFAAPGPAR